MTRGGQKVASGHEHGKGITHQKRVVIHRCMIVDWSPIEKGAGGSEEKQGKERRKGRARRSRGGGLVRCGVRDSPTHLYAGDVGE